MVDFAILQGYNTNLAFEKRKKKIILSLLFIHISRIDYDNTWSNDCEISKKKKRLRGRQEEEGTSSGLSVVGGVLSYMGCTSYISA